MSTNWIVLIRFQIQAVPLVTMSGSYCQIAAEIHLLLMALNSNQILVQLSITFTCECPKCIHIMAKNIYSEFHIRIVWVRSAVC
jgi:hypothetical protein